ncbi:DUF3775 domain-containing protein [Pontivivens ytuae]|uniref:DUF3775 domain-containing protein n=1 Tax=Pontivivens ytuae TaxID=2789856 RepID=A0A7S9QCE1_9RHOB|nr:DUF3775 domain-containing protein [Pontivivens ytuae]QPH54108.1 DUF3775 domain-containing protein [Pontivivens ytuae]
MKDLTIPPDAMRTMIQQLRALGAGEDLTVEEGTDLRRNELQAEIASLDRDQQHELVALLWVGRGDFSEDEWEEAVALAEDRHTGPCFDYIIAQPLAADEIAAGLEEIGHDHLLLDGDY